MWMGEREPSGNLRVNLPTGSVGAPRTTRRSPSRWEEERLGNGLPGFDRQMCLGASASEKVWPTRGATRPAPISARMAASSRDRSPSPYWRSAMVVTVTSRRSTSELSIVRTSRSGSHRREAPAVGDQSERFSADRSADPVEHDGRRRPPLASSTASVQPGSP